MRTVPATSPPIPQANKVEVIASVIDAVATGADTPPLSPKLFNMWTVRALITLMPPQPWAI